ncbi:MAG: glucose-1-phosphate thymidylyltransferase [Candidatus Daviesbacteria bacterium]|nr:glucose-1-phosphate thymidylyltransferase [Candidatus Daviesbacteria bacterium]
MKAIIPTGGRGTRMRPLTFSTNKHFIPIANKPLIFYPIETVVSAGIKEIALTYNPGGLEEAQALLGDGGRWGVKFTYVLQENPKGLANIFQVCEEYLDGESFLMHNGDNIFVDGISDLVDFFLKEKPNALVTMVKHKDNKRLGVPLLDNKGQFVQYIEKPENPPNNYGIPGLYFFDNNVFKCFKGADAIKPSERGELEISAPYNWLIEHKFRVDVLEYKGVWMDPGKFDDWLEANKYLLEHHLEEIRESQTDSTSTLHGKVSIGKDSVIINSQIQGPVIIGDNVFIKDSFVGSYTSINNNCEIVGSKIGNSVLMSGVKIHGVRHHPMETSLIGTDSEIIEIDGREATTSLFVGEKCKIQI